MQGYTKYFKIVIDGNLLSQMPVSYENTPNQLKLHLASIYRFDPNNYDMYVYKNTQHNAININPTTPLYPFWLEITEGYLVLTRKENVEVGKTTNGKTTNGKTTNGETKQQKYYVMVNSGYERPDVYSDISDQIPIIKHNYDPNQGRTVQEVIVEDMVAIDNHPTKLKYTGVVNVLFDYIENNNLLRFSDEVYNPIFVTNDLKSNTINEIINLARALEYSEIWGRDNMITEYRISPEIVLAVLQLHEVEAG